LYIGYLVKTANTAKEDNTLNNYLKIRVNKPIYGFRNEVSELFQIFSISGHIAPNRHYIPIL